jgi:serine protease Do
MKDILKHLSPKQYLYIFTLSVFSKLAMVALVSLPFNAANAQSMPGSFADLADKLLPSVVNISTTQNIEENPIQPNDQPFPMFPEGSPFNDMFEDFFGQQMPYMPRMPRQQRRQQMPATSLGSGFIIDAEKGYVITNNHVIAEADEIKVTLHDDTILAAELVGSDDKTDIAVLKVDLSDQKIAETSFGNSDTMRVGDWVIAIGNPFGLGGTVTAGIISARQRDIHSGPYDDYIQTDASINRGNSGGPMFNKNGEVIGINTAIYSPTGGSVGIGFAIPSSLAQSVINQLIEFGRTKRGWLGVKIQTVTDDIAESLGLKRTTGALIAEVTPTGPAEKAGFQSGDVILVFDGKPVKSMRELPRIVAETKTDKAVDVVLWRNGKRISLDVTIGELEKAEENGVLAGNSINPEEFPESQSSNSYALNELGLKIAPVNTALRQKYDLEDSIEGLVVLDADLNSDAAKKGIGEGDVIIDINQKPVQANDEAKEIIKDSINAKRDKVLLLINSNGRITFIAVKLNNEQK